MTALPPAVNWHLWPTCNFHCGYCFQPASSNGLPLPRERAFLVPKLLAAVGVSKLTFVGGEPTLHPELLELIACAKQEGLTTMLVTNGSLLKVEDCASLSRCLDWLSVSIDTFDDTTARAIGRGNAASARHAADLLVAAKTNGIRTKVNVVVNALNHLDVALAKRLESLHIDRLKVFRVLHVPGVNTTQFARLAITDEAWLEARGRYEAIGGVCEDNDDMRESYAMLDSQGCFFQNADSGYVRGRSILDVGVAEAFGDVRFDERKFAARGGKYDWSRQTASGST